MSPASPTHPLRGILLMSFAVMLFATLDATGKYLAQRYPVSFLVWARYAVHFIIMLALLAPSMRGNLMRTRRLPLQLLRSVALVATSLLFLTALFHLPLAEGTALMFLTPLLVTVLAGPALGEKVAGASWAGLISGFVGVLLIVRPGTSLSWLGVLLVLGSVAMLSVYHLMTRLLSKTENSFTTLFYTAFVGTAIMSAVEAVLGFPEHIAGKDVPLILSLGVSGGVGHFLLIRAFHHAPASVLMPFTFTQLVWAALLGWIAFGQFPDVLAATGMAIIGAGGAWVAMNERQATAGAARATADPH